MYKQIIFLRTWAQNHVRQSQLIIGLCYLLLFVLYYSYGQVLKNEGIKMPASMVYICLGAIVVVYAIHEVVHRQLFIKKWFIFHKFASMVVLTLSFCGLLAIFTQPSGTFLIQHSKSYAAFPMTQKAEKVNSFVKLSKETARINHTSAGGEALLIILVVIMSLLLEGIIAMLSCSLACSGSAALASIVLLLGTVGVIVLGIFLIKGIIERG